MNQLATLFLQGSHAPYLLGSYAAAVLVLAANACLPALRARRLRMQIRREIRERGGRS
jgi:heme exporter protein CcmD